MKLLSICLLCVWSVVGLNDSEIRQQWKEFQKNHGKTYRSLMENQRRFDIFKSNLHKIEQHNLLYKKGLVTHEEGVTKFSDWTEEEFMSYLNRSIKPHTTKVAKRASSPVWPVPPKYDCRLNGTVTEVKDQGHCGSCWAFSAVGSVEGALARIGKKVVSLSAQNLVDCSRRYGNQGCNGGWMSYAYDYIADHGIETEEDYPYQGQDGRCHFSSSKSVARVSGIATWSLQEDMLKYQLVHYGPIAIAIDATARLQNYRSGILSDTSCSSKRLNHGVLLVGYDEQDNGGYYLIKNSWGKSWGENGYFRLGRMGHDPCGITQEATYPDLQ